MRLRQFVIVAQDLESTVEDFCAVLGIEVAFRDPDMAQFDLRNAVLPIGDTFLEVVSPIDPKAAAQRYLERHRGPGGYMLLVQSERLDIDRARLAEMGVRTVWKLDLADIRGTHLHPKDTGGTLLSIDDATPPASWRWAGPIWEKHVRTTIVDAIVAADLQSEDPRTLARRWSEILDQPFHEVAPDHYEMRLESGRIRFVADRDGCGEGLRGLDLRAVDRGAALTAARARGLPVKGDRVTISGVSVALV